MGEGKETIIPLTAEQMAGIRVDSAAGDAWRELQEAVERRREEQPELSLGEAFRQVCAEQPHLGFAYLRELNGLKDQSWSLQAIRGAKNDWEDIWRPILERPDGSIDQEQLKKELSDFSMLISFTSLVYEHVTGGRISKPLTLPEEVCRVADDITNEAVDEALKELRETLEEELDTAQRKIANLEYQICPQDLFHGECGHWWERQGNDACPVCAEIEQARSSPIPAVRRKLRLKLKWNCGVSGHEHDTPGEAQACIDKALAAPEKPGD